MCIPIVAGQVDRSAMFSPSPSTSSMSGYAVGAGGMSSGRGKGRGATIKQETIGGIAQSPVPDLVIQDENNDYNIFEDYFHPKIKKEPNHVELPDESHEEINKDIKIKNESSSIIEETIIPDPELEDLENKLNEAKSLINKESWDMKQKEIKNVLKSGLDALKKKPSKDNDVNNSKKNKFDNELEKLHRKKLRIERKIKKCEKKEEEKIDKWNEFQLDDCVQDAKVEPNPVIPFEMDVSHNKSENEEASSSNNNVASPVAIKQEVDELEHFEFQLEQIEF